MIVVATDEEYALAKKRFPSAVILTMGVGGTNVIRSLRGIPLDEEILNFGYVGSNNMPIGSELYVSECMLYHPGVDYVEQKYSLYVPNGYKGVKCYTSNDFVTETKLIEPVVFDMELAFIKALGFKNVSSFKIVSDNLNLSDYTKNIK